MKSFTYIMKRVGGMKVLHPLSLLIYFYLNLVCKFFEMILYKYFSKSY